jgi:hypothetical protein
MRQPEWWDTINYESEAISRLDLAQDAIDAEARVTRARADLGLYPHRFVNRPPRRLHSPGPARRPARTPPSPPPAEARSGSRPFPPARSPPRSVPREPPPPGSLRVYCRSFTPALHGRAVGAPQILLGTAPLRQGERPVVTGRGWIGEYQLVVRRRPQPRPGPSA